jgi:hypothetical protein
MAKERTVARAAPATPMSSTYIKMDQEQHSRDPRTIDFIDLFESPSLLNMEFEHL